MALHLGDAFLRILARDETDSGLKSAERKLSGFEKTMNGFFERIGHRAFDALTTSIGRAIDELGKAVQASSNLNESINKTSVVFAQNGQDVLDWSRNAATAMGLSQQSALAAASSFGALFRSSGFVVDSSTDMSKALVQLAGDLASFNNISTDEALVKLRAGLVGETEPLRTLGVNLLESSVQAKAMELGLAGASGELSQQDKILARYNIILEQTALAQGDYARTADQTANAQRTLSATFADGAAQLGDIFRPAYTAIIQMLQDLAPQVFSYAEDIAVQFANGLASVVRQITPILVDLKNLLSYWLKPGSPPRLLPDIDKWGAGVMRAYLDGFTQVNVKSALGSVGKALEGILRSFVGTGRLSETDVITSVLGGREAIARAVREFEKLGRVTSETMADIVRQAGPAGASVAALVRSYFNLQRASQDMADAQEELNSVTESYNKIIDPLQGKLSANTGAQDAIRDELRLAELRQDITDSTLAQEKAVAAQQEITAIRGRMADPNQNWVQREKDRERLIELEGQIQDAATASQDIELSRLEIEEISLRNQLDSVEEQKNAATDLAQKKLDAAKQTQLAAERELAAAQAIIDLQTERNRLLTEEINLQQKLEKARLDALEKIKKEQEDAQKNTEAVDDARFDFEFATSDTAGQLALLNKRLGETEQGTVDYYRVLGQIAQTQERYNKELKEGTKEQQDAERAAQALADAQFDYQFSLADTAGQLDLLKDKLAGTEEGSAEYYRTLLQQSQLQKQYQSEIEQATEAQFNYQLAIADTPEKIELLRSKLAETTQGSAEYFSVLTQLSQAETQRQSEIEATVKKEQAASEAIEDARFRYNLGIADTITKIKLLKDELSTQQAGSVEYYNTLGQIKGLEAQLAQQQAAEAEKNADAYFNYQLALADTAGKLELLKGKLEGLTPGSAEYYDLLTRIADTEKKLAKERGDTGIPGLVNLTGATGDLTTEQSKAKEAGEKLAAAIDDVYKALRESPAGLTDNTKLVADSALKLKDSFGDAILAAGRLIGLDFGPFARTNTQTTTQASTEWDRYGERAAAAVATAEQAARTSAEKTAFQMGQLTFALRLIEAAIEGDWAEFWRILGEMSAAGTDAQTKSIDEWVVQIARDIAGFIATTVAAWRGLWPQISEIFTSIGTEFYNAGVGFVTSWLNGIKDTWSQVTGFFTEKLKALRDLLPGSEPKDPASPLRGLAKRGQALVENIQAGIDSASFTIKPVADKLLSTPMGLSTAAAGATSTGGDNFQVSITIQGNASEGDVRRGVTDGIRDALRRRGR